MPKTTEIVYSAAITYEIRKKDPELKAMAQQWEQAFGSRVDMSVVEGKLTVRPRHIVNEDTGLS